MVTEVDLQPMEDKLRDYLTDFKTSVKDIKFGKLTPETFKSIKIYHQGKQQTLMDMGQIIPVNAG